MGIQRNHGNPGALGFMGRVNGVDEKKKRERGRETEVKFKGKQQNVCERCCDAGGLDGGRGSVDEPTITATLRRLLVFPASLAPARFTKCKPMRIHRVQ